MKTRFRSLLLGGLLPILAVAAQAADFEGRVSLSMTAGKDRAMPVTYTMKGTMLRMDIEAEGQAMASIINPEKKEMIMLMPDQQMYMVMPIKAAVEAAVNEADLKQHNIEKTGRTDTILGYKCEEYVSKDKHTVTEIWIAEGLGTFMGLGGGSPMMGGGRSRGGAGAWENVFKGKPGFPMRVITRDAKSAETFKLEVTKIEPGGVSDADFQPPAGYQKFQMPGLGGLNPFGKG